MSSSSSSACEPARPTAANVSAVISASSSAPPSSARSRSRSRSTKASVSENTGDSKAIKDFPTRLWTAVKESNAQSYNRFLGFVLVRLGDDAGWQIYVDKKTGSLEMLNSCLAHGGLYFKSWESFERQLTYYQFKRITDNRRKTQHDAQDPEIRAAQLEHHIRWRHVDFRPDYPPTGLMPRARPGSSKVRARTASQVEEMSEDEDEKPFIRPVSATPKRPRKRARSAMPRAETKAPVSETAIAPPSLSPPPPPSSSAELPPSPSGPAPVVFSSPVAPAPPSQHALARRQSAPASSSVRPTFSLHAADSYAMPPHARLSSWASSRASFAAPLASVPEQQTLAPPLVAAPSYPISRPLFSRATSSSDSITTSVCSPMSSTYTDFGFPSALSTSDSSPMSSYSPPLFDDPKLSSSSHAYAPSRMVTSAPLPAHYGALAAPATTNASYFETAAPYAASHASLFGANFAFVHGEAPARSQWASFVSAANPVSAPPCPYRPVAPTQCAPALGLDGLYSPSSVPVEYDYAAAPAPALPPQASESHGRWFTPSWYQADATGHAAPPAAPRRESIPLPSESVAAPPALVLEPALLSEPSCSMFAPAPHVAAGWDTLTLATTKDIYSSASPLLESTEVSQPTASFSESPSFDLTDMSSTFCAGDYMS